MLHFSVLVFLRSWVASWALLSICKSWNEVDEPFDCVVYAGALWAEALAAVENVLYAAQDLAQGGSALPIIAMRAACVPRDTRPGE